MASVEDTAAQTLAMLEDRLRRVEFLINGQQGKDGEPSAPTTNTQYAVSTRLHNLERGLQALANRSNAVYDILVLHQQYPDLFHTTDFERVPSTLAPGALAQLILAHEQLYKDSSGQLQTLSDISTIPDSSAFTKLIALEPQIEKIEARQAEQARIFAELRARSAQIVEQWYESGVLEMGERWADWEEKLRDCEIVIRRQEAAKKRDEGTV